jgi:dienelactone hydrolase
MLARALRILPLLSVLLAAQPADDPAALGRKALDLLLSEKYPDLAKMFTAQMLKDFPEATMIKLGAQIKTYGAVQSIGLTVSRKVGVNSIVVIPVKFALQSINFQFAINGAGQVAGLVQLPGAMDWQRPAYSKPDTFTEREVTVGEDEWKLSGTLTVPNGPGPFPAVALVHGSGPNDRDETVGGTKVFKDLAEGLASRGIVVLRYEKRTKQYSARMANMATYTVQDEAVDDAAKAAAMLQTQPQVDPRRVFVLGHGLGGYVAPRIAEEEGKLAGLILLAGNVRPIEDLALEQVQYLGVTGQRLESAKSIQAKVKSLENGDGDSPPVMGVPAAYWLDLKGYDPAAQAKKLGIPMLILQGERDYQVTLKDFALWKAAVGSNKGVVMKTYPALNHLFVAGEGKSLPAEYSKPGHVAPEVVEDIALFVNP